MIPYDKELQLLWQIHRRADEIARHYKHKFGLVPLGEDEFGTYDEHYNCVPQFQQDVYGKKAQNYLMKAIATEYQGVDY